MGEERADVSWLSTATVSDITHFSGAFVVRPFSTNPAVSRSACTSHDLMEIAKNPSLLIALPPSPAQASSCATLDGSQNPARHRHVVDWLRAFAAVAVCLFHFGRVDKTWEGWAGSILQQIASRGHLGVEIFFVISGFVIPLSMGNWQLRWRSFQTYLGRRLLRLYPPYFAVSLLSLPLWWAASRTPGFRGSAIALTAGDLFASATLTAGLFGKSWILLVAWTLAIELQFYLAAPLIVPLLLHAGRTVRWITLLGWIALPFVWNDSGWLTSYAPLFGLGLAVYLRTRGALGRTSFVVIALLAFLAQQHSKGTESAIAALLAAASLFAMPGPNKTLAYLGAISYSLYLVHVPIGGRVVNLGRRLPEFQGRGIILVLAATALSILVADAVHRWIERPWMARSRSFGRTGPPRHLTDPSSPPVVVEV